MSHEVLADYYPSQVEEPGRVLVLGRGLVLTLGLELRLVLGLVLGLNLVLGLGLGLALELELVLGLGLALRELPMRYSPKHFNNEIDLPTRLGASGAMDLK